MRRRAWLAALAIHFFLIGEICCGDLCRSVSRGETILPIGLERPADRVGGLIETFLRPKGLIRSYLHLAGAENGYSYFAPNVADSFRLSFALLRRDRVVESITQERLGREGQLRLATLVDEIGQAEPEEVRAMLLRSAAYSLGRKYPEVTAVRATLSELIMPTVREFAEGKRSSYQAIVAYDFVRDASVR